MAKVNHRVSNLTVTRDGYNIKADWRVPPEMTDPDNPTRATWIDIYCDFDVTGGRKQSARIGVGQSDGSTPPVSYKHSDRFWIRGQNTGDSIIKNFDRTRWHPCTWKGIDGKQNKSEIGNYCKNVKVGVFGGFGNSMKNAGQTVWATYSFYKPRAPKVTWGYAAGDATVTVETDPGDDNYERYDTMVRITVKTMNGTQFTTLDSGLKGWFSTQEEKWTRTFDISSLISALVPGKCVKVKCEAYARGMAGDSAIVTSTRIVALPSVATVGTVTVDTKKIGGRVRVPVTPNGYTDHVKLQRRHGESGPVEEVSGAEDDVQCKALYDSYASAAPVAGEYIYYRVVSSKDGAEAPSAWKRADCLYTAKPKLTCSATVGIVSATPGASGTTASVVMGWTDSTPNTGWELTVSDYEGAWNSTEPPSPTTGTTNDATSKSAKYKKTKTLNVTGLAPGKTYYARVRRYREAEGKTYYSGYSGTFAFATESAADDRCGIISASPSKDGTSCTVVVGYTEDSANQLTELSWSTSSGAWSSSSVDPEVHTYPTQGGSSSTKWAKQVTLGLSGLVSGTTYYVRARRCKTDDGTATGSIVSYSPYSATQRFSTESAADDRCGIIKVSPSPSGTSATVQVGFNEDNANTGTEISWSDYSGAWQSNEQPETLLATWPRAGYSGSAWTYYQTSYLRNLTPGKAYYVKARRYLEAGGRTTYSPWSRVASFNTHRDTAANDKCGIVSTDFNPTGSRVIVVVGWNEDVANDGTELSWSSDFFAWTSNEEPETLNATWSDKNSQSPQKWKKTQTISLYGLERGVRYHIRARRYKNDDEGTTFSPYSTTWTYTVPAKNADLDLRCGLVSVEPGDDGTSAEVIVGWSGDRTGCEVTWSKDPDAWESSENPQMMTLEWQDEESKSAEWSHTATCYLRGLEQGETYYVRARSCFDSGETTWSAYSDSKSVTPYSAPESVSLTAPESIARGESIELWWTIQSEMEQKEWHVHDVSKPNVSIAEGTGSLCRTSLPAEWKYPGRNSISMYIEVGCGGGLTASEPVTVAIADAPACEVYAAPFVDAQPVSFLVYTNDSATRLLCTIRSTGITHDLPDGAHDQLEGDVVWTEAVSPSLTETTWGETELASDREGEEDDVVYVAEVHVPVVELLDGGTYVLQVSAIESIAGLKSEVAEARFGVAYSHQAPDPVAELTPDVESRTVRVALAEPEGFADGDVYDVYRKTPTGYELAARGISPGAALVDSYAPFGGDSLSYAVCCRTPDGDTCYREFGYELPVHVLRFDWDGGFVELPHNIELRDSYGKSFESRAHADGSVSGYYDRSVEMTGSYSSEAAKVEDPEAVRMLRTLADHPGACFCRTPEGDAFQCNADVSEIGGNVAGITEVSFDVTRVRLTEPFWLGDDISGREGSNG